MVEASVITSEQNIEVIADNVLNDMEVGNEAEKTSNNEEEPEIEDDIKNVGESTIRQLVFCNQTEYEWIDAYCQTEEDGEWMKAPWDYEKFGNIQRGDGFCFDNIALNEHYFAVKVITEHNEEVIWTYDLIFGQNISGLKNEEPVVYVEPDWEYLIMYRYPSFTSIYWTYSDETAS